MPKRRTAINRGGPVELETVPFRQHLSPTGSVVLDRPFTPEEKQRQDELHRAQYLENRRARFAPPVEWEKLYGVDYPVGHGADAEA